MHTRTTERSLISAVINAKAALVPKQLAVVAYMFVLYVSTTKRFVACMDIVEKKAPSKALKYIVRSKPRNRLEYFSTNSQYKRSNLIN